MDIHRCCTPRCAGQHIAHVVTRMLEHARVQLVQPRWAALGRPTHRKQPS
jgi:hypothetical protein